MHPTVTRSGIPIGSWKLGLGAFETLSHSLYRQLSLSYTHIHTLYPESRRLTSNRNVLALKDLWRKRKYFPGKYRPCPGAHSFGSIEHHFSMVTVEDLWAFCTPHHTLCWPSVHQPNRSYIVYPYTFLSTPFSDGQFVTGLPTLRLSHLHSCEAFPTRYSENYYQETSVCMTG